LKYAPKEVLDGLKEFDSATVFNAVVANMGGSQGGTELEAKGGIPMNYTGPEMQCLLPELGPVVGYVVTAEMTTNDTDSEAIGWSEWYEAINNVAGPVISVIKDVDTRPGRGACLGDGMANMTKRLGVAGFVVDGSVRDLAGIKEAGVPTWGTGRVPGHGVFNLVRVNSTLTVARMRVSPGEIIVADGDGCARIPADQDAADVLGHAREIREHESKVFAGYRDPSFSYEAWKASR